MAVAELTLVPIGTDSTSVSSYIAKAVGVLDRADVDYELTAMGTIISTDNLKALYEVIAEMQEAVFKEGANRVYSVIKVDDRRDKSSHFKDKVKSVKEKL